MASFAESIQKVRDNDPELRTLSIEEPIEKAELEQLADALKNNTTLIALDLWDKSMTPDSLITIINALKENDYLKFLNIATNHIGDKEEEALADYIKLNESLIHLTLWNLGTGEEHGKTFMKALKHNHSLKEMKLWDSHLDDATMEALADSLKTNTNLSSVIISIFPGNTFTDAGAAAMADMLLINRTLTRVSLGSALITEQGEKALENAAIESGNKNLVELSPSTEELQNHVYSNHVVALDLATKIKDRPQDLIDTDRQEITERMPAILDACEKSLRLQKHDVRKMFAASGITIPVYEPITGAHTYTLATQRRAAARRSEQGL